MPRRGLARHAAVAHLRAALADRQALLAERDRARERVRELEGEK